jgi:hypothetical protein
MFEQVNDPVADGGSAATDDVAVDPLSQTRDVLPSHYSGDGSYFHDDHCPNRRCSYARGHGGPCSDQVQLDADSSGHVSSRTRRRRQAPFSNQAHFNIRRFLFQSLFLFTPNNVSTSDTPYSGHIPEFAYATALNQTLFVNTETSAAAIPIPKGVRQALNSKHASYWLEAIMKEYTSILQHNVFTVVRRRDLPPYANVMHCHLIFTVKVQKDGSVERFKARLVAGGDTQKEGVDFQAIFSTVVHFSTLRMAVHLAAVRDYNITSIDVSTAFLYGSIDVEAYMRMPDGLPRYDADGNELVCKLLKSIYGLKQAPRIWYEHFTSTLTSFGFVRSEIDPCLFVYKKGAHLIWGLLWVDDLILVDNCPHIRTQLVKFLESSYKITDKGEATWLLGISLTRDRAARTIALSQTLYIKTVCSRFEAYLSSSTSRNYDIPAMSELADFGPDDCPVEGTPEYLEMRPLQAVYFSMVGALIWLTSTTRPDCCASTAVLSRFSHNPAKKHFTALLRVFLYLHKDAERPLILGGSEDSAERLMVVTDSSHEEGPSLSGVFVVMGSAVIDWICRRQKFTARNSTAAEAMANADGCDDGLYKRELAKELGVEITPIPFATDNESAVKLHSNYYSCKKSKHILRAIATLRHFVMTNVFVILHIPGLSNIADLLTKPLSLDSFTRHRNAIMSAKVALPLRVSAGGGVRTKGC